LAVGSGIDAVSALRSALRDISVAAVWSVGFLFFRLLLPLFMMGAVDSRFFLADQSLGIALPAILYLKLLSGFDCDQRPLSSSRRNLTILIACPFRTTP